MTDDGYMRCPDCGAGMVKRDGKFGAFYGCSTFPACKGSVPCNKAGDVTATPANAETRELRRRAHIVFDALWKGGAVKGGRRGAYRWLRKVMDVTADKAHIAQFNKEQCELLIAYAKVESQVKGKLS